jgi:hypothetical protein
MLKIICLLLFFCTVQVTGQCQTTHRDSLIKAAQADAKKFKLDDAVWKKYKRTLPPTSDYFKPEEANQKNLAQINDSLYVKAYRQAAFKRNKHRHTPWHYVLLGGSISAGVIVVGIAAVLIFIAPGME